MSEVAGEKLCPSTFGSHIVQVNFGKVGNNKQEVDKWHFDSVDYVLVIILSDIEDMVGGELEVFRKNLGGKEATKKLAAEGLPQEYIEAQSYAHSGYGILAQGSKIMHRVTPVLQANEDRISFVISLSRANAFGEDNTRTLKYAGDHPDVTGWEMARHEAWRQQGFLKWIIEESDPNVLNATEFATLLDQAAARLQRAARINRNEEDDWVGFIAESRILKSNDL